MRVLLLCLGCLLATVAAVDYVEIDTGILLDDESKWKMLFNCLMGRGPCDEYEDIKGNRTSSVEDFERLFAIDVQALLEDKEEWKFLFECLMDIKPCGQYDSVKDTLPKLVQSRCERCTPEQKEKFDKTLKQFLERYPADYTELSNKLFPKPA